MLRNLDQAREAVRAVVTLEELIERYGIEIIGGGRERKAICPFHADTDPSLGISIPKQVYFCHGCREDGDIFSFVQTLEGISHVHAIRHLAEMFDVDLSAYEGEPSVEDKQRNRFYDLYADTLKQSLKARRAGYRAWVKRRQFDADVLDEYGIGFMNQPPQVSAPEHILRMLQLDHLKKWAGRITIPLRDDQGRVTAFRTRSLDGSVPKSHGPLENHPLDVPPVYGFWEARKAIREAHGVVIAVEGEPDLWQMIAHGYRNTVCTLGNHLNDEQVEYLRERGIRQIIVLPDGDEGGRRYALSLARHTFRGVMVQVAELPEGDPDDMLLQSPDTVAKSLAESKHAIHLAIDWHVRQHGIDTTTQRMEVLYEVAELVKEVAELEREAAFRYLADLLGFTYEYMLDYFRLTHTGGGLHDVRAEQQVLSKALQDDRFVSKVLLDLHEDDFYLNRHKRIYRAMGELFRAGQPVTEDTIGVSLRNAGFEKDTPYLAQILEQQTEAAEFLLADIKDKSTRRQVLQAAERMAARIQDTGTPSKQLIDGYAADMSRIIVGSGNQIRGIDSILSDQMTVMHERISDPKLIIGLDLGQDWYILNHTLHGLQEGCYFILAAPSGVGKTAICCAMGKRVAVDLNEPTLMMSFETGADALSIRMLASMSGVESDKIITGFMDEEEVEMVHEAAEVLSAAPLLMTGRGAMLEEGVSIIRHDILKRGTKLIILDYIQLMSIANADIARHQEVGMISRSLFELCQDTGTRIIAAAQINREGARKARSEGTDVGEGFKIFQDCDVFYIVNEKTPEEIEEEGIQNGNRFGFIDKWRHGRSKVGANLYADLAKMRIGEVHS